MVNWAQDHESCKRGADDCYCLITGDSSAISTTSSGSHVLYREYTHALLPITNNHPLLHKQKELTHTILLHPSYFGPRMLNFLESKLYSDVEGTCSGQFGYIIAVVSILDIGKGMVLSGSGQAEFITRYRAIVFKPFKGEVVDGVVNNVNKVLPFSPRELGNCADEACCLLDGLLC